MPVPVPELGQYNYVPETKVSSRGSNLVCIRSITHHTVSQETLDWADLVTIDLSEYGTPEGNKKLAQELIRAVREDGFFYVKGFNISQERVNRQFAIGNKFYAETPLDEKLKYVPDGLGECLHHTHQHIV